MHHGAGLPTNLRYHSFPNYFARIPSLKTGPFAENWLCTKDRCRQSSASSIAFYVFAGCLVRLRPLSFQPHSSVLMEANPAVHSLSPIDNIRAAYQILERNVVRALQAQLGDDARLEEQHDSALSLLQAAIPVPSSRLPSVDIICSPLFSPC